MELTKENYFDHPDFTHSSQIKTYLESRYLYLKRYVEKDENFQFQTNSAVNKGVAVDGILTEGKTMEDFKLTPALKRDVIILTEQIPEHPIWQELMESATFQKIIEGEINGMKFAGKLDAVNSAIWDLKITTEACAKNAQKWLWHCVDMKYNIAGAVYQKLEGGDKPFYHLATYIKSGIVYMKVYRMPQEMLDAGMREVMKATEGIKTGNFDRKLATIDSAEVIPWVSDDVVVAEEDNDGF